MPPPLPGPDDLEAGSNFWQWLVGIAATAVAALGGRAYALGRKTQDIESRLKALEEYHTSRTTACTKQREEIFAELRREMELVIRDAVTGFTLVHNKDLAGMDKNIALQSQALAAIQEDVRAIFSRLDRRSSDQPTRHPPVKRRSDDTE